ncbi:hypothetical protein B0H16DRAFT_1308697 [Mycena metata]|uniref:Uncharacterized protein n=1 Tax=Mycena metata TaxID=1033252 RepID=A0AAD7JL91_9AGAR|nr:hypothetical protein B0H16DRAFT_1308697 [Mycena metata]
MPHLIPHVRKPVGLIWDSENWSCAYDASFTILANLWAEDSQRWTGYFGHMGGVLGELGVLFQSVSDGMVTLETARNLVRRGMNARQPDHFPYGSNTTSIDRIAQQLFPSKHFAVGRQVCRRCHFCDDKGYRMLESYLSAGLKSTDEYPDGVHLTSWLERYLSRGKQFCPSCRLVGVRQKLDMQTQVTEVPPIMLLDITHKRLVFSEELCFNVGGRLFKLKLRGIIYGGQAHFTCRFIQKDGSMWFHDGITTGNSCIRENRLQDGEDRLQLHKCGEKSAVAVIYALVL